MILLTTNSQELFNLAVSDFTASMAATHMFSLKIHDVFYIVPHAVEIFAIRSSSVSMEVSQLKLLRLPPNEEG
jgi:hypothetical protein